jgi:hypothetical protein
MLATILPPPSPPCWVKLRIYGPCQKPTAIIHKEFEWKNFCLKQLTYFQGGFHLHPPASLFMEIGKCCKLKTKQNPF